MSKPNDTNVYDRYECLILEETYLRAHLQKYRERALEALTHSKTAEMAKAREKADRISKDLRDVERELIVCERILAREFAAWKK